MGLIETFDSLGIVPNMHPLMIPSNDTSAISKKLQAAVISFYIEFADNATEIEFWSGSHTYNGNTYKRNLGLSLAVSGGRLRFYWYNDNDTTIFGNEAFNFTSDDGVIAVLDDTGTLSGNGGIRVQEFPVTLDDYSATVKAVIDWRGLPDTSSAVHLRYKNEMMDAFRRTAAAYSGIKAKADMYPLFAKKTQEPELCIQNRKAILNLCFLFDSSSDEESFWGGNHTGTSHKRSIGLSHVPTAESIRFYWLASSGRYISGDRAFTINKTDSVLLESGTIQAHRIRTTLDGFNVTIVAIVDWGRLVASETQVFAACYNSQYRDYHKAIGMLAMQQQSNAGSINFGVDGDSITAGNQWSYIVSNMLGFATHHNVAVGSSQWQDEIVTYNGVTYYPQVYGAADYVGMSDGWGEITSAEEAQKRANNSAKVHVMKFIDEVSQGIYPEPDIFVFALGTNDNVSRLGTVEAAFANTTLPDYGDELLRTTTGAMRWCIQKIKETYPNCKILWSSPIQSTIDTRQSGNETKIPVMTEVANRLSVEIIDQWNNSGISAFLEKATPYYLRDGIHPNDYGRATMAQYAASVLSGLTV